MKNKFGIFLLIVSFLGVDATISYAKKKDYVEVFKEEKSEIRGVYISYLEYFNNFYGGSKTINQAKIDKMLDNVKESGFNTVFLHVSPFSDSIYESTLFPYSYSLTGTEGKNPGFDYLDYFIKVGHMKNIKIHAWINPYRISFDSDTKKISTSNPAYQLLNTSNVGIDKNGIYYNPASEIVKDLIINQIKEIIDKYDIDGIHFDDYFYMQKDIDKIEYALYQKKNDKITLKEFRLMNTNDLIKRVYQTIKEKDSHVLFSIAPDGNINNNYLYHYADIKTWLSSNDYLDIIMPQIYYGFENEYAPFLKNLESWMVLNKAHVQMIPVLAIYKCGTLDKEAGNGSKEWINNTDILTKQINMIRNKKMDGYTFFRYDFMFSSKIMNDNCVKEMANVKKIN